jgi:acyl-CoA reductase-like NAD-dependent aldehyde dehydrogenase
MPALVVGNTVVLKPSPYSPLSAFNLMRILEEAGLPPGVANLVFGRTSGRCMVRDPGSDASFTGSIGWA